MATKSQPSGGAPSRPGVHVAERFRQAVTLHQGGRLAEAETIYRQIIDLDPNHAEAIHHLGVIAFQAGHPEDAVGIIRNALAINPRNAAALSNLGLALQRVGRHEEALANYDRAIALTPAYPEALYNRGNALRELNRLDEALASYDDALVHRPTYVEAHVNRGRTLRGLGRPEEAIAAYDRALQLRPGLPAAELNQGFARLTIGDFAGGLPQLEARWREEQMAGTQRSFAAPLWDGREPLQGATLLLHAEQGFGDTIHFCRYVPLLAARGARVVLEAQPVLVPLLRTLDGVASVVPRGERLPDVDFHCPLMTLPLVCGTRLESIPAAPAYLRAEEGRVAAWQNRLGPRRHAQGGTRIGLVWSGSTGHRNDRNRSLPLSSLTALFTPEREFVSLQKEVREADLETLRARADCVRSFGDELTDFADTAALVSCVDLVIAVDTAGAHLAGALGRPLWLLLPFAADWRWLLGRRDSPWYPTARLFRQPRPGDWASVIAEVETALRQWPGAGGPTSAAT
jgi:Flp pilus assembly protein TadD